MTWRRLQHNQQGEQGRIQVECDGWRVPEGKWWWMMMDNDEDC